MQVEATHSKDSEAMLDKVACSKDGKIVLDEVAHGKDSKTTLVKVARGKDGEATLGEVTHGKDGEVALIKTHAKIRHGLLRDSTIRHGDSLKIIKVVQASMMFQFTSQDDAFSAESTWGASTIEAETGALSLRNG